MIDQKTSFISVMEESYDFFTKEKERLGAEIQSRFPLGKEDLPLVNEFFEACRQVRGNRRLLMQFFDENGGCELDIAINALAGNLILN